MTADMARRLAAYFENSATYWMALQSRFELDRAIIAERVVDVKPRSQQLAAAVAR